MDYCLCYAKPNLFCPKKTVPWSNLRRQPNRRRALSIVGCSPIEYGYGCSLNAPLEPKSPCGVLLSGVLLEDRDGFKLAAEQELEWLVEQRNEAEARTQLGLGSSDEACLHRRIAESKRDNCKDAVEDVMYAMIVSKFLETSVHLIPRLSKCIYNGRLEILPSKDWELQSIHTSEVLEMVRAHITAVVGLRPNSNVKESWTTTVIKLGHLWKLYSTSISYGYFLKSASLRHRLEWGLESSHSLRANIVANPHPVSEIFSSGLNHITIGNIILSSTSLGRVRHSVEKKSEKLKGYLMGFDHEMIEMCAKPKSKEAEDLIERHSYALFEDEMGSLKENEVICTSFASLKRLVLEAVAFGSFLWETEDFVNDKYMLEEN